MELHENTGNYGGGVFAWGGKACEKAQIAAKRPPVPEKNRGQTGKRDLQTCGAGRKSQKGPRWSCARNQMGNINLCVWTSSDSSQLMAARHQATSSFPPTVKPKLNNTQQKQTSMQKRQTHLNLSCHRAIKVLAIAVALGAFFSNQLLRAQITLSGISEFSANSSGDRAFDSVWNTLGGDTVVNIFVANGPNLNSPFINGPSDAQASISIALFPGIYTFTDFGGGGSNQYANFAMNLFFNGDNVHPGISVFGPTQTSANPPYPSFAADGSASTVTLAFFGNPVAGANSLSYQNGNTLVTLTSYRWAFPSVYNVDRVYAPSGDPGSVGSDGSPDWVGQFTLDVTTVPEPGTWAFLGLGIAAFAVLNRRKTIYGTSKPQRCL